MTGNAVRAEVSEAQNGSPGFSSSGDYERTIPENTGQGHASWRPCNRK